MLTCSFVCLHPHTGMQVPRGQADVFCSVTWSVSSLVQGLAHSRGSLNIPALTEHCLSKRPLGPRSPELLPLGLTFSSLVTQCLRAPSNRWLSFQQGPRRIREWEPGGRSWAAFWSRDWGRSHFTHSPAWRWCSVQAGTQGSDHGTTPGELID